ncbi:MAG: tRNA (N(6)-L-threonylcarbamoyladenosine(37)-C(2))-methylthiotransferase MtaB [Syntrophomonadaceae bacterium]|nr:tRNA (N(6)-L-threonylcarbamoyladenosine(37)-C(2))-methylthiotransferase MtaB [Syntrophomonadaceae bacterium]
MENGFKQKEADQIITEDERPFASASGFDAEGVGDRHHFQTTDQGLRIAFATLGCKVNQVEIEALREEFVQNGYQPVEFTDTADIYVINTCAVTGAAEKKSRAMMRRAKRKNPLGLVIVTGCYGQVAAQSISELPEVDLVVSNNDKEYLLDMLNRYLRNEQPVCENQPRPLRTVKYTFHHPRTRGFVKIQDGCDSFCSYCIVPLARGRIRSKLPHQVREEVRNLAAMGYREIVLNGIHLGNYGKDLEGWKLSSLLRSILEEVPGNYRIRLGSLEPNEVDQELIEIIQRDNRFCKHLHIPLQSGSDKILKSMNRSYTSDQYLDLLQELFRVDPKMGLTADVMVGFPGEGRQEYEDTLELVQKSPLNDLHVFRYSSRPGTKAAVMPDQINEKAKAERSHSLIKVGRNLREKFLDSLINYDLSVLTEEVADMGVKGLSENYVEVLLPSGVELNQLHQIRIRQRQESTLLGEVVEQF